MRLGVPQTPLCSLLKQQETVMAACRQKMMPTETAPVGEATLIK